VCEVVGCRFGLYFGNKSLCEFVCFIFVLLWVGTGSVVLGGGGWVYCGVVQHFVDLWAAGLFYFVEAYRCVEL
jgi:hypothetical protein